MKKIKEFKMSLMEKEGPTEEKNKNIYVVKCSGTLAVNKIVDESFTDEQYESVLYESANLIFNELKTSGKGESLGLWITFEDGEQIDNSIDIAVLDDIKTYGPEDVNPIAEFFKMTLEI